MLRIEVKHAVSAEQKISPSTKEGAKQFIPFTKVSQTAYVHGMVDRNGSPEPFALKISLDLGTKAQGFLPAFAVGFYSVDSASYFVDRFDNLCLGCWCAFKTTQPCALNFTQAL